jgi:hypothetical protein
VERLVSLARLTLLPAEDEESSMRAERLKKEIETQVKLVTMYILLSEHSEYDFKRLIKQSESLKISRGMVECFKEVHFFSWLLLKKMHDKTLKAYKVVRLGDNNLCIVQVEDKQAEVKLSGPPINFYCLGQELEHSFRQTRLSDAPKLEAKADLITENSGPEEMMID